MGSHARLGVIHGVFLGLVILLVIGGAYLYADPPVIYPVPGTDLVTGTGTPNKLAKWTAAQAIGNGSLLDTATQQNQSVCFDDNGVLNCGGNLKWNAATNTLSGGTSSIVIVINSLLNVMGISGTSIAAHNLRGSCTFAGGVSTCPVVFPTTESDANYQIVLGCNANKAFWKSAQLATGFTLQESAPGSGGDACSWVLIR